MSEWDAWRARQRGADAPASPKCSTCGALSVLDPCRSCSETTRMFDELDDADERAIAASLFDTLAGLANPDYRGRPR